MKPMTNPYNVFDYLMEHKPTQSEAHFDVTEVINPRIAAIMKFISNCGYEPLVDVFLSTDPKSGGFNTNVYVTIRPKGKWVNDNHVFFLAHHDVANPMFDNANDNTASVAHLLTLIAKLSEHPDILRTRTLHFIFTDREETGMHGVKRFYDQFETCFVNNFEIYDLELTGYGDNILASHPTELSDCILSPMPFNQATFLRTSYTLAPLVEEAICLSLCPEEFLDSKEHWNYIHGAEDSVNKIKEEDMINFNDYLWKHIINV